MEYFFNKVILLILIFSSILFTVLINLSKNYINILINYKLIIKIISLILLLSSIYSFKNFILNKFFLLSFLDKSVFPCKALKLKEPTKYDKTIKINIEPNTKVIYWASEENKKFKKDIILNYEDAYNNYDNMGIVISDKNGDVELKFRTPISYSVPYKKNILKPHIHYRKCIDKGMMSKIHTIYLD